MRRSSAARPGSSLYALAVRLVPSQGLIISTHVLVFLYGELMNQSPNYGAGGGRSATPIQLGPGSYGIVVRRSGIGNSGYERLEKALGTVPVTHTPGPPQPPPPAPVPPHIDVRQNGSANATLTRYGHQPSRFTCDILFFTFPSARRPINCVGSWSR